MLTRRYPVREVFWAQLMTALQRAGRLAEAREAYQRLHRLLTEEYGIEPSRLVQDVHRGIVIGDVPEDAPDEPMTPPRVPRPQQLPADIVHFVGRRGILAELDALLPGDAGGAPGPTSVATLAGAAGVGKTALAVHWASRVAQRFPDGQLYANLRGFEPGATPVPPADVVRVFLSAFGVAPPQIPADRRAQAELYRSRTAGRRMLVVLDNAHDAEQVRPLLPATAGCVVLITSRVRMSGLIGPYRPRTFDVGVLDEAEALQLLRARLGAERVAEEPAAAHEIVERCGRLPLALTTVATRAVVHPTFPLSALAEDLPDASGPPLEWRA